VAAVLIPVFVASVLIGCLYCWWFSICYWF